MQIAGSQRREDVATTIKSCLIARQEDVTIPMLERDYEDVEGEKIPFREFKCPSLLAFLQQLKNTLWIDNRNGIIIIHPIESEKTRHVSSLVQRQRPNDRTRKTKRPYRGFQGGGMRATIDSRLMMNIVKKVKQNLNGISIKSAVDYVNKISSPVQITRRELELQLKGISHEVLIWGDNLYPTNRIPPSSQQNSSKNSPELKPSSPLAKNNRSRSCKNGANNRPNSRSYTEQMQKFNVERKHSVAPAEKTGVKDDFLFRPAGFTDFGEDQSVPTIQRRVSDPRNKSDQQNSNRKQNQNCPDQTQKLNRVNGHFRNPEDSDKDSRHSQDYFLNKESPSRKDQGSPRNAEDFTRFNSSKCNENSHGDEEPPTTCDKEFEEEDSFGNDIEEDLSLVIKISTKIRLIKLIQQCPEGIWCAELPKKYLYEYKTPLIYTELGFTSVRDFASYLPDIFHCLKPAGAGDYKLYSANKPPPDLRNEKRPVNIKLDSLKEMYKAAALPEESDPKMLLPEGAMEIEECIKHSSVAELGGDDDCEEIEVLEVFSPSFFWVQLRRNLPKYKKFMDDLNAFYEKKHWRYKILPMFLEKGLNVACIHSKKWQRGIVKTVFPDERVSVHFFDSGLEKSYAPDDLCFLHRMFSYLPAQAIPCGLFNVKPYQTTKWSKSVTWEFISKTSIPLIATIGSTDLQENSMLVILTDTRGEEDLHINDWMYEKKFGQKGQMVVRNQNFAFSYYKECLERKGYDPSAVHNIRPLRLKSNGHAEDLETEAVEYKAVETKSTTVESSSDSLSEESRPGFLIFKRTQALLAKYQAKQEAKNLDISKSPTENLTSDYKQSFESPEMSPSKLTSSIEMESNIESESRIEMLKAFLNKENLKSKESLESAQSRSPLQKSNLHNQNFNFEKKIDTSIHTKYLCNGSVPTHSPLLLKQESPSPEGRKEDPFFGSIKSECGGNGRMEPINWNEVRSALIPKSDQPAEKNKMDLKTKTPLRRNQETEVPLVNSSILNIIKNDLNSTFYDKNVRWVPENNSSFSTSSNSSLLNLKRRLHSNSYKKSDVLISSKVVGILKGEVQDSEENEVVEPIKFNEVKIEKQKIVYEEKHQVGEPETNQSKSRVQLPPRILRLLELQNKTPMSSPLNVT